MTHHLLLVCYKTNFKKEGSFHICVHRACGYLAVVGTGLLSKALSLKRAQQQIILEHIRAANPEQALVWHALKQ